MRGLAPLEGERVHRVVRAHPLQLLPAYAPGLALLALSLPWAAASLTEGGLLAAIGLDESLGAFAAPTLLAAWWGSLGVVLAPFALRMGRLWPLAYGVGVSVVGGFVCILVGLPDPSALVVALNVPWITAVAALGPLGRAEVLRRSDTWVFTSFRVVRLRGFRHPREESWRLTRLDRCDMASRGPRGLDFGDLSVLPRDPDAEPLRIRGVRPLRALRDELELLLHTTPEAPYLGEQRSTADRVQALLRPGDPKETKDRGPPGPPGPGPPGRRGAGRGPGEPPG